MTVFTPPAPPARIEDTGLSGTFLINLIVKTMTYAGTMTPAEMAEAIAIPRAITRNIVDDMVKLALIEALGLSGPDVRSEIRYALTERGRTWASDALAVSQYVGPAPVTIEAFAAQVKAQSIVHERIHRARLDTALSHLVLGDDMVPQLGPAVNSARSVLLYGEAGNGKTSIAEAMGTCFEDTIYLPYAIIVRNQIIQFHDETIHVSADYDGSAGPCDARWVPCRRPVVISGGELTLQMLDLIFEPQERVYEAPMHTKATGGVFIVDDFGRQRDTPRAFLNRWIAPLEKGFDILTLHTGKKFVIPFDQLVVFSTNKMPDELSDSAALRRLFFKIFVPSPSRADFLQIFRQESDKAGLPMDASVVAQFFDDTYGAQDLVPSGAHPGFLIKHVIAAATYMDRKLVLTRDLLDLAWKNVAATKRSHH